MKPALQIPIQPKKTVIKELCNECGTAKFQFIYICPVIFFFLKFISAYCMMLLKPINTVSLAKLMTTETELVK